MNSMADTTAQKRKAAHVVTKSGTLEVCCLHCGRIWLPALPMPIDEYVGMGKAFLKSHVNCKPKE
jgi:hypothetical protein